MRKIEDEINHPGRVADVRRGLDHAERRDAVREHAAQFAVEIGLARPERRYDLGDRRVFVRPVEPVRVSSLTAPWSSRKCSR